MLALKAVHFWQDRTTIDELVNGSDGSNGILRSFVPHVRSLEGMRNAWSMVSLLEGYPAKSSRSVISGADF